MSLLKPLLHMARSENIGGMSYRVPWQRGDRPQHFVAVTPEETAEVWWKQCDSSPLGWCFRIEVGATIRQGSQDTKQLAANHATALWSLFDRRVPEWPR